jgi:NAD-dependent deacetylase
MSSISPKLQAAISRAARRVQEARHGVVLTGAGISTPSGIPDFRSQDHGLWRRFDPLQVASLSAFRYRPESFFGWLRSVILEIQSAYPNPAHHALASLEASGHIQTIVTQNVDGLHHRAGSKTVVEVHGTLRTATCIRCYTRFNSRGLIEPFLKDGAIPHCPDCGGILKPDIILFEEQLPVQSWMQAQDACRKADLMMVVGSSLEVLPVAGLPMLAVERGAPLIMINISSTYIDVRAEVILQGDVAEILPILAQEVAGE